VIHVQVLRAMRLDGWSPDDGPGALLVPRRLGALVPLAVQHALLAVAENGAVAVFC
jgi:hypothetical protein